ncbi:GNAT family N-acetyltransferase [Exiguobacterium aestuarii]|uniref:GNAT family N-acetyltransferase n=1 Tax=Exiguobacterium aestuarii TaxID=273527 RepID=A0ABW2PHW5_9BACL|nr:MULTISPECIES: GNAT family N-acetyltransferase [Exiguobacterium]MCT4784873.1 GNAT family N-acetyltransferase [Exiguobacterium aestuarii]
MSHTFHPLTQEQAELIAFEWRYEGDYAFYNMDADEEDLALFLDADERGETTFAILDDDELIGFVTLQFESTDTISIGLGMRPDLTGNRNGNRFLTSILDWIEVTYKPCTIQLAVATFNKRAIRLYESLGFIPQETFMQETNGGVYPFLSMKRLQKSPPNI